MKISKILCAIGIGFLSFSIYAEECGKGLTSVKNGPEASLKPRRYVVIDTNVVHKDPSFLLTSPDHIVIPRAVLAELDSQKNDPTRNISGTARSFLRTLNTLIGDRPPKDLLTKGYVFPDGRRIIIPGAPPRTKGLDLNVKDEAIIATALAFKKKQEKIDDKSEVILMTNDFGARILALEVGVHSELLTHSTKHNLNPSEDMFQDEVYVTVDPAQLSEIEGALNSVEDDVARAEIFNELFKDVKLGENQFIVLVPKGFDPSSEEFFDYVSSPAKMGRAIFKFRTQVNKETGVSVPSLLNIRFFDLRKLSEMGVVARNLEQVLAIDQMMDPEVKFLTVVGQAGTGKTILAIAAACRQGPDAVKRIVKLKTGGGGNSGERYQKILLVRPTTLAGESIGYLPGTKLEKVREYFAPIADNLEALAKLRNAGLRGSNAVEPSHESKGDKAKPASPEEDFIAALLETGRVHIEPIQYLRGRSLPDTIIVVDEAQNMTADEAMLVLTRAGEGTKIIFVGDIKQIDHLKLNSHTNGLTLASQKMGGHPIVAHVSLKNGVRSELATLAADRMGQ